MTQENILSLKGDLDTLVKAHHVLVNKNDFGGALNIIKNIDGLNRQLSDFGYLERHSVYKTIEDGEEKNLITLWKQNEDNDIKDIQTWVIKEKYNSVDKIRFYKREMFDNGKDFKQLMEKQRGEVRILSVSFSTYSGHNNDTVYAVGASCSKEQDEYIRTIFYIDSKDGGTVSDVCVFIKKIFKEYKFDFIVLDLMGVGISVYDELCKETRDSQTEIVYPPFKLNFDKTNLVLSNSELLQEIMLRNRTESNFPAIICKTTTAKTLSDSANLFKDSLIRGLFRFSFFTKSHLGKQTDDLVKECESLECVLVNGYIKLKEPVGGGKNRYEAISNLNYVISKAFDNNSIK